MTSRLDGLLDRLEQVFDFATTPGYRLVRHGEDQWEASVTEQTNGGEAVYAEGKGATPEKAISRARSEAVIKAGFTEYAKMKGAFCGARDPKSTDFCDLSAGHDGKHQYTRGRHC